jgi:hypothetical protein
VVLNKIPYRRVNRATREDLSAFESRMEKANVKWNTPWHREGGPAGSDNREPAAKENSTYA